MSYEEDGNQLSRLKKIRDIFFRHAQKNSSDSELKAGFDTVTKSLDDLAKSMTPEESNLLNFRRSERAFRDNLQKLALVIEERNQGSLDVANILQDFQHACDCVQSLDPPAPASFSTSPLTCMAVFGEGSWLDTFEP